MTTSLTQGAFLESVPREAALLDDTRLISLSSGESIALAEPGAGYFDPHTTASLSRSIWVAGAAGRHVFAAESLGGFPVGGMRGGHTTSFVHVDLATRSTTRDPEVTVVRLQLSPSLAACATVAAATFSAFERNGLFDSAETSLLGLHTACDPSLDRFSVRFRFGQFASYVDSDGWSDYMVTEEIASRGWPAELGSDTAPKGVDERYLPQCRGASTVREDHPCHAKLVEYLQTGRVA